VAAPGGCGHPGPPMLRPPGEGLGADRLRDRGLQPGRRADRSSTRDGSGSSGAKSDRGSLALRRLQAIQLLKRRGLGRRPIPSRLTQAGAAGSGRASSPYTLDSRELFVCQMDLACCAQDLAVYDRRSNGSGTRTWGSSCCASLMAGARDGEINAPASSKGLTGWLSRFRTRSNLGRSRFVASRMRKRARGVRKNGLEGDCQA
jgi:hypothetical protein